MRFLLAIVVVFLLGSPAAVFAQDAPRLEVPVPGLELTPIIHNDANITVPWLAQYIGGVYTFLLSIAGVLAAVMMVVGGFQYVTSAGDKSKIGAAKSRIRDALAGLVLALGSYTVLYAINPSLIAFDGLKIMKVNTELAEEWDASLGTTTVATDDGSQPVADAAPPAPGTPPPPLPTNCPFTLSADVQSNKASGRKEFYDAVLAPGVLKSTATADKIVEIGVLAIQCKAWLGSCGRTAGAINAMAGVFESKPEWSYCCLNEAACVLKAKEICKSKYSGKDLTRCLKQADNADNCNDNSKGKEIYAISQTQRMFMYALRCDNEKAAKAEKAGKPWPACSFSGPWPASGQGSTDCKRDDCKTSGAEARKAFNAFLENERQAGRLKPYPELQRGDRLVIYNGNNDIVGAHAIIFTSWAKDGKRINVIQGSAGTPTHGGSWCVHPTKCGDNVYPITNIWRP